MNHFINFITLLFLNTYLLFLTTSQLAATPFVPLEIEEAPTFTPEAKTTKTFPQSFEEALGEVGYVRSFLPKALRWYGFYRCDR